MVTPTVFFHPVTDTNKDDVSRIARTLFEKTVQESNMTLEKKILLKVHTGQPGNVTFIQPKNFDGIIDFLQEQGVKSSFVETGMVTGPRSKAQTHIPIALKHGFTRIPLVIADGDEGKDHVLVPIHNGKHFTECMIARKLAEQKQVVVLSHFKGHIASGFAAAIKMLGIGFASRQGKIQEHSNVYTPEQATINWAEGSKLYGENEFAERVVEYAVAAVQNKKNVYLNFALSITSDCDCDGREMKPIYTDLGIFSSTDPVAIDKACFDMLVQREGKRPFDDWNIFPYAEKLGLGSASYTLKIIEYEKK